jgi:hypothetical protein
MSNKDKAKPYLTDLTKLDVTKISFLETERGRDKKEIG